MSTTGNKDANDLHQFLIESGETPGEYARELLKRAPTMVEMAARWAGKLQGAERDDAIRVVFELAARMTPFDRSHYRKKLSDLMGVGIREFNDMVRAALKASAEGEGEAPLLVETLGGYIGGYLVEYLYDPVEETAKLAYRDPERKIMTADYLDIEGIRYVPFRVIPIIRDKVVLFASELGGLKSPQELVTIIEAFIHQHYLLGEQYLGRVIAYYVLMTWVYDAFNAIPYLRAVGEAGSGKSELMRRVGQLCYRLTAANGAGTAATFFRMTEMFRGTVFIDEADLHDGGDMANDIVKFLNLGAMKGNPFLRMKETIGPEGGKDYHPEPFNTFCPKLIAMRRDFRDDAVQSRSITIPLMPREPLELKRAGVKLGIDQDMIEQAQKIRNLLLRWRLQVWEPEIPVTEELMDIEISARLNQVTMPLKALARDDKSLMAEIESFLRAYNQEMVLDRSMTIAARVVEAIWKIYKYPDLRSLVETTAEGREFMMIGDVRRIANEIMDEMNALEGEEESEDKPKRRKKDELSARGVGMIVRKELQLQVGARRGTGYPVFWDETKMEALGKRYGVDYAAILASNGRPGKSEKPEKKAEQKELKL